MILIAGSAIVKLFIYSIDESSLKVIFQKHVFDQATSYHLL